MKKILHVLCEGQTEERFCAQVLKDYLKSFDIVVKPQILVTNKKKNCRGGLLHFAQVERDLSQMFKQFRDTDYEQHWFTSMFDFYALPDEFPGYDEQIVDHGLRVVHLEEALGEHFNHDRFIPYIQLHEFEALVFAGLDKLKAQYAPDRKLDKAITKLENALEQHNGNPEEVNDSPVTAPSKRIIAALAGLHNYNKKMTGPDVAKAVGINNLKTKCAHFALWLDKLESLS